MTYFLTGQKPVVRISRQLYDDRSRNHHVRYVLAQNMVMPASMPQRGGGGG